jgi:elongation factor P
MIDVNDLRKGTTFELESGLYKVLEYSHNKSGRGNASIRVKAANLRTGAIVEKTFQSGDRVQDVRLDFHNVQYLYTDGQFYHFMDLKPSSSPPSPVKFRRYSQFLKEGMEAKLTFTRASSLDIEVPPVDLKVVQADIAVRRHGTGDRRSLQRPACKFRCRICYRGDTILSIRTGAPNTCQNHDVGAGLYAWLNALLAR